MAYKKPTLTEIYCEYYFDEIINNQKQYELANFFNQDFEFVEVNCVAGSLQTNEIAPRYRMWRDDKRELLQIFANRIAFNYLPTASESREYDGFDYFYDKVENILAKIIEFDETISWNRLSLCYIDKIISDEKEAFHLGKYINCTGKMVAPYFADVNVPTDLIIGKGDIRKDTNRQFKLNLSLTGDNTYLIRMDTIISHPVKNTDDLKKKLYEMHNEQNDIFYSVVTDFTKDEYMGGLKG